MEELNILNFEDIRPFNDAEVSAAISRLKGAPQFEELMKWIYPSFDREDVDEMLDEIQTIDDFQSGLSGPAFKVIAQKTTSGLTFTDMDHVERGKAYLFLSNHRDIILDSALLNVSLMEKGFPTTQIAIGDNLLQHPVIQDLVRLNKNFIVNRNVNPKLMLQSSQRLSNYIRNVIVNEKTSIWIAQREGRSKDGDDRTSSGLLKMLAMSGKGNLIEDLREINILPTVVSYEYDPCDIYKLNELLNIKFNGEHEKREGEDYRSMLKGLTGHKGRVNISVASVLDKSIEAMADQGNKNEQIRFLASHIDRQMHEMYRLWPSNYIAFDMLHGGREYSSEYSNIEKFAFRNYMRGRILKLTLDRKKLGHQREGFRKTARELFLQMYANPVINYREVSGGNLSPE